LDSFHIYYNSIKYAEKSHSNEKNGLFSAKSAEFGKNKRLAP